MNSSGFAMSLTLLVLSGCEDFTPDDFVNAYNNATISTYGQQAAASHGLLIGTPSVPSAPAPNPQRVGESAARCISYSGNPASTAFFKGSVTNSCTRTVWVSYCAVKDCQSAANFYDSALTLRPGQRAAADLDGNGIRYAACYYDAPHHDTPTVTNNSNGAYDCN